MRHPLTSALFLFGVALASVAPSARAAEGADDSDDDHGRPHKAVAFTFDPLGVLDSRFAAQVEVVLGPDVSMAVTPWIISMRHVSTASFFPGETSDSQMTIKASGVDGQFRWYPRLWAHERAPEGLFVAPGIVLQRFEAVSQLCEKTPEGGGPTSCGPETSQKWAYYGPAIDVGYQYLFPYGIVTSLSAGVHYRFATPDVDTTDWSAWSTLLHGPGLRPRLRAGIGMAF